MATSSKRLKCPDVFTSKAVVAYCSLHYAQTEGDAHGIDSKIFEFNISTGKYKLLASLIKQEHQPQGRKRCLKT